MPIHVRKSGDRGYFDHGWLRTYHTFSFAQYDDPDHRGFRSLRVINEDRIRPGTGFPVHAHQDMEIFSIVLEGGLSHQDDLGNASILRPGKIQLLSAGTGITHSEFNASDKEQAHFLQIWIKPSHRGLNPSYKEKNFSPDLQHNRWGLIISSNEREGSLLIHQNVDVYLTTLDQGKELEFELALNRYGWIQVIEGEVEVNGILLESGDGASVNEVEKLHFQAHQPSQLVFFDLN